MNQVVLRHQKLKSTSKGVAASHNHREGEAVKKKHAPNIFPELTYLNKSWIKGDAKDMVGRILAKLPEKRRKDAVECVEVILSASPEFFDAIETDREKLSKHQKFKQWCDETIKWARHEYGKNIIDCVMHMDEKTPHFHISFVPLTADGRLCGKEVLAKKELIRRQTDYANAMSHFGLKRGLLASVTKRKHTTLKEDRKNAQVGTAIPPVPEKNGLMDIHYVDRLLEHAKKQQLLLTKLLAERQRVKNLELMLSKGVIELPDVKQLRAELKSVNEQNAALEKQLKELMQVNKNMAHENVNLKSTVLALHEQVESLMPAPEQTDDDFRRTSTPSPFNSSRL